MAIKDEQRLLLDQLITKTKDGSHSTGNQGLQARCRLK
jgi:hypothetical protein